MPNDTIKRSGFSAFRRHPIFPAIVFVLLSSAAGEFYPLSPYSMFSNPDPRPLEYCYLTDGTGTPLPTLWHTGQSPASITKKYNRHRSQWLDESDAEEKAGLEVLNWLRDLSLQRRNRELTDPIRLVEVSIDSGPDGKLAETAEVVAELK